jgi:hypothetical protein
VDSQELKVVDLVSSQQVLLVKVVLQDGNQLRKGDLLGFYIHKKPPVNVKNEFFISVKNLLSLRLQDFCQLWS